VTDATYYINALNFIQLIGELNNRIERVLDVKSAGDMAAVRVEIAQTQAHIDALSKELKAQAGTPCQ
jgi:GH25 family lysozyme M1 (1,4-beta-N-acetylmuramidase)